MSCFVYPRIKSNCRAATSLLVLAVFLTFPLVSSGGVVHLTDNAGGLSGQDFGGAVCGVGDLDGDNLSEILIGAPGESNTGAAFLWQGNTDVTLAPAESWYGLAGEKFGFSVALIGDVDNDGTPDFAVGAPLSNDGGAEKGRVCIFFGGSSLSGSPDLVILGQNGGDQFGFSVAAAGDFNGDGKDDFIVGAPYYSASGEEKGAAYVIYGRNGGPSDNLAEATKLIGEIAFDHFGWSVCAAGDFLGNEPCVAVGAPGNDALATDAGKAYVFEGSVPPFNPNNTFDHVLTIGDNPPGSQYGWVVRSAGHWDSDGYEDLAVGAPTHNSPGTDAGRIEIIFGGSSPSDTGDRYATGQAGGHQLGYSLDNIGDYTGNNRDDLLIGAPFFSPDGANAGRAYLYEGGTSSSGSVDVLTAIPVDPLLPGTEAQDQFGFAVAGLGDFDGDGLVDFAIAAPAGNIENNATAGYCRVLVTDDQTVAALDYRFETTWTEESQVRLDLSLPWGPEQIRDLEIHRTLVEDEVIHQGPATGLLILGGTLGGLHDYSLIDEGPFAEDSTAQVVAYRVVVQTRTGNRYDLNQESSLALDQRPGLASLQARQAWPNPANPRTALEYRVASGLEFDLSIHDLRGRRVSQLMSGRGTGQWVQSFWQGNDDSGRAMPSGLYFFQLRTAKGLEVRKVMLAR